MSLTTWYMRFTFSTTTPVGFPKIIDLYFKVDTNSIGNVPFAQWYNIDNTTIVCTQFLPNTFLDPPPNFASKPQLLGNNITNLPATYNGYNTYIITFTNNTSDNYITINVDNPLVQYNGTYQFQTGPFCFSEGTKILCYTQLENSLICIFKEEYRLVQHLKIGDLVKSYLHGYRKVSKLLKGSFVNNPNEDGVANCMYIMKKTQDNGLIEDLTLTRNHGVLVEKLTKDEEKKVDIKNLPIIDGLLSIITADCDKFEKVLDTNVYKYYHFSLGTDGDNDRRFGVWANGLLVETPSNNMMDGALNIKSLDF